MRSELPWVQVVLFFYAESVVAKTFPVGNNPFRVSCCWGMTFTRFALQPWATRNNAFGVGDRPLIPIKFRSRMGQHRWGATNLKLDVPSLRSGAKSFL